MQKDDGTTSSKVSRAQSRASKQSRTSTAIELEKLELKKKAAALRAKLTFKEKEKQLREIERKAKAAKEEYDAMVESLEFERKLAESEAELEVLEEYQDDVSDRESLLDGVEDADKMADMERFLNSDEAAEEVPPLLVKGQSPQTKNERNDSDGWERVTATLEKCVSHLSNVSIQQCVANQQIASSVQLPKIDVPVFSGDPLNYPIWRHAFTTLVDSKPLGPASKLMYLNQYVAGKAKEVVQHYMLIGNDDGYEKAMNLISKRYGSPSCVSSAFTGKLSSWPKIGPKDCSGLMDFADFLGKVDAAKHRVKALGILDYPQENAKLVDKLPSYLEGRWRDEIDRMRENGQQQDYPPFSQFVEFVRRAANKANIPELAGGKEAPRNHAAVNPKARTFSTSGKFDANSKKSKSDGTKHGTYRECPFCQGNHAIDECKDFVKKPMFERKAFFFQRRLCMGCGATDEHRIKECRDRKICKECNGQHLSCLHYPRKIRPEREEGTANCTSVCSIQDQDGRDHSMIVPVWVRHAVNPSKEKLVYAVLDDQSNVSFMSEKLCVELGIKGTTTDLLLTTMHESSHVKSDKIRGVEVLDYKREHVVQIPVTYTREMIPASRSQIPKKDVVTQWPHLSQVAAKLMPYDRSVEVSLLIGNDCPRAIRPREIVTGGEDDPYAQKSLLGWGIIGRVCKTQERKEAGICNKTASTESSKFAFPSTAKEVFNPQRIVEALEMDFRDENKKSQPFSMEDKQFLRIMESGIRKRSDGHYEMPLPLKSNDMSLPNNRGVAEKRWRQLNARFRRNHKFMEDYQEFMRDVIETCAERAPSTYVEGKVNYVPHTGVYHPKKPGKIRVVFDCSAKCEGISLNDNLLQGPDLTNGLLGVLCRFRQEDVAFVGDIKGMFHQFFVSEEDRDLLRFLWWEDGDPSNEVVEYRMMVHLFGATSSPGCANFGFKRAADDNELEFGSAAASYIRDDFYVDDGLKSVSTVDEAVSILKSSQDICKKAGLRLHKLMSNRKDVLQRFPAEDWAKGFADLDLEVDPLPIERALGVTWCVENDSLQFRIEVKDQPLTRRGILSTVGSIFDPIGLVSPVTLSGKQILQELCRRKLDWDSPLPDDIRSKWEKWRNEIYKLEKMKVPRCYKPADFGKVKCAELHHFSDASYDGYGQCSYLRQVNEQDEVCCSLVIAKSRVTPLKPVTIPRLELTAATVSAKMSAFLRKEMTVGNLQEYFWTDSKVVLGYIHNEARRFHVYVANRVQQIHEETDPKRWFYVNTKSNPADEASRGMTAKELLESSRWLVGPEFLHEKGEFKVPEVDKQDACDENDPEVKKVSNFSTKTTVSGHFEASRLKHISTWQRVKRVVALCLRFKMMLQQREIKKTRSTSTRPLPQIVLSVEELKSAEREVVRSLQREHFHDEVNVLQKLSSDEPCDRQTSRKRNGQIKPISALYRLDPYIDQEGIMRVGGRINRANLCEEVKHPVIMPRNSHMTTLLVRHKHEQVNHMGRGITHNRLRQNGYWVIGGSSAVSSVIARCVMCRRLRGTLQQQKMAELPKDRLDPAPPFTYCAVDYFGPFNIKEKRSFVKRYGVLFTCMTSRAVHLESANSLTSSSFINCLRRFLSRRGPVRQIRSDRGTAFVGARNELKQALQEMDQDTVHKYLSGNEVDWIPFKMNTPHASHMGGVWERQISTVRRALEPVMMTSGSQLDDESFQTFLTEVESIVNSRPLTTANLCSADAPEPLTPNHLLTMKAQVVLPPPGKFQREDTYARKWWRRVQYLTNEFWTRWRREYLQQLQTRQKWVQPNRDLAVGDVVIVKDSDDTRSRWPLGRVTEVYQSDDGRVRSVKLLMADRELQQNGTRKREPCFLERPIHKLVLILSDEQ